MLGLVASLTTSQFCFLKATENMYLMQFLSRVASCRVVEFSNAISDQADLSDRRERRNRRASQLKSFVFFVLFCSNSSREEFRPDGLRRSATWLFAVDCQELVL